MKLTRSELVHAQDRQLAAVGITRSKNAGWLADSLTREFTKEQVELFHSVRKKKTRSSAKGKAGPLASPTGRPQYNFAADREMVFDDELGWMHVLQKEEIDRLKSELAEALEVLAPFALYASQFVGRDDIATPIVKNGNKSLCVGAFQSARSLMFPESNVKLMDAQDLELGYDSQGRTSKRFDAAEDFANDLFRKTNGKLD